MCRIYLENNRLKLEILEPGKIYTNTRFDWMGMINQVTLDNNYTFCQPESKIEGVGTNGQGFFNEFGIEEPIGYKDAKVGENFPKLGIGLLTKFEEAIYKFNEEYKLEPFDLNYDLKKNYIAFNLTSKECRGYQIKQSKTITIENNTLKINYSLENIGNKPFETTEYSHNFVAINNKPIGPDYVLRFSKNIEAETNPQDFIFDRNEVRWDKLVDGEFYFKLKNYPTGKDQYWELIDEQVGVGVRETLDFEIARVAVWGRSHVISPEAFIKLSLLPGEKECWERKFVFFNTKEERS